jgi:hypothetical protein
MHACCRLADSGKVGAASAAVHAKASSTCALLILLLGNQREYTQRRPGLQMSSSQRFLPRLSRMGREEKSSSQSSEVGSDVDGSSAAGDGLAEASAVLALASASTVSALQLTLRCLLCTCCGDLCRHLLPHTLVIGAAAHALLWAICWVHALPSGADRSPAAGGMIAQF